MGLCLGCARGQEQEQGQHGATSQPSRSVASTSTNEHQHHKGHGHGHGADKHHKQQRETPPGGAKKGAGPGSRSPAKALWVLCKPKAQSIEQTYTVGGVLGEGTTAVVREATSKENGGKVAVKVFRKSRLSPDDVTSLMEEVTILKSLDHTNIIKVYDFMEDPSQYFLVMELVAGGELFDRITKKSSYTEKEARDLFKVLVGAIKYCHDHDVVHRDLKPENLLLKDASDDITVKIADFGFAAKLLTPGATLTIQCGTPGYVAPEILKRQPYGKPVDMWSLGVITYILLGGYPPFYDKEQRKLFEKIKRGMFVFHPEIWDPVSQEAKDLICRMLRVHPEERLTADQALKHPWVLQDDATLNKYSLETAKGELKKFNARRKFRAGVRSIMAANRLCGIVEKLKQELERQRIADASASASAAPPQAGAAAGKEDGGGEEVRAPATVQT